MKKFNMISNDKKKDLKTSPPNIHKKVLLKVFIGISLFIPFVIYLFEFHGSISANHVRWAEFGSYLGGIYSTFAFLILAYTTNITRKQFKTQNEDNIFFKLYDSLQKRILNNSIKSNNITEHLAHQTLKIMAEKFYKNLEEQTIDVAKRLLCETPDDISNLHFTKIFEATKNNQSHSDVSEYKREFIKNINSQTDFASKWETLKHYIGTNDSMSENLRIALKHTGSVNFYKIPFFKRQQCYKRAVENLSYEYGEFLDGYFKSIRYLIEFADNSANRTLYIKFIKSQLSKYELIIIFYLFAGLENDSINKNKFHNSGILDGLLTMDCQLLILDTPSIETLRIEINNIFNE